MATERTYQFVQHVKSPAGYNETQALLLALREKTPGAMPGITTTSLYTQGVIVISIPPGGGGPSFQYWLNTDERINKYLNAGKASWTTTKKAHEILRGTVAGKR